VELRRRSASAASAAPTAASSAASAASGDADVPGWLGDPGDRHLPGSAASASAAASGARARALSEPRQRNTGSGNLPGPVFFCLAAAAFGRLPVAFSRSAKR